jgi:hypothetical protein
MFTPKDFFDFRDTKFTIGAIYPPKKQKFLEDKLRESAAADGVTPQADPKPMTYVFTLDEALNYFKSIKEAQDMVLAEKAGETTAEATDA